MIGNGYGTIFWYDQWHPIGPLYQNFAESPLSGFGLIRNELVTWCMQGADGDGHAGGNLMLTYED